jgi:DNA-binding XRE family transcriptional regulator
MGPSEQPQPALGKAIRQLRRERNLNQEALAYAAGVTAGTLSLIEVDFQIQPGAPFKELVRRST